MQGAYFYVYTYLLISILPPVNVSHAEFDCIASNSIIRSLFLSPPAMLDFLPPIHHLHQQGKKCHKTEDDAAARADETVTVKTPKSLRGSDVATDETETQETAVAEDEKESGKGKNSKKKGTEDAEEEDDAAARADADGETTSTEESGKGKGSKKKEEEEEVTETRAEGDAETEMVVEKCHGKKCNKKNIAEAKDDDEEIVVVALDKIVACEGKGCKGKIANVTEAVAEAIEGSIEVKASKMKASKMKASSKISKISGDEEAEVSIPLFISGFTR